MVANFKKKNNNGALRKKILLHVGGGAAIILLVVLLVANIKMYQKRREFLVQAASLQNQIKDLKKSNGNLQEGIAKENDPEYIEKVAREELDLQKPGETAVSFVMPSPAEQKPDGQNIIQGWFLKSLEWVKSIF